MEITSALAALSTLVDVAKTSLAARDAGKAEEAINSMRAKLTDLYASALERAEKLDALQSANASLARQVEDAKLELVEKSKYRLVPLGRNGHAYLLLPHAGTEPGGPPTYFCQHCKDKGVKSILRDFAGGEWDGPQWECIEASQHSIYK